MPTHGLKGLYNEDFFERFSLKDYVHMLNFMNWQMHDLFLV